MRPFFVAVAAAAMPMVSAVAHADGICSTSTQIYGNGNSVVNNCTIVEFNAPNGGGTPNYYPMPAPPMAYPGPVYGPPMMGPPIPYIPGPPMMGRPLFLGPFPGFRPGFRPGFPPGGFFRR
jgi:hypothetical protein